MTYKKATAEVILFDNSDVITASQCTHGNSWGQCNNADGCHKGAFSENSVHFFPGREREKI